MPSLTTFREGFKGVRPNRFRVEGSFPASIGVPANLNSDIYIYVKAADLPGTTIGQINVAWQGRVVKFSGERVYADWAIMCYESNVSSRDLRLAFERWMEAMDGRDSHRIQYNLVEDWIVRYGDNIPGSSTGSTPGGEQQINFNKAIILKNCFPVDIGPVTLNYDLADSFSEFTVQIAYDYWIPQDSLSPVTESGNRNQGTIL